MAARTADVVVVGAGIMGLSIAYQLARRGAGSVVVVEKGAGVAEGSTGASSAVVRCRYTYPETVTLARDGQIAYRKWGEFTRLSEPRAFFNPIGVLWMMHESRQQVTAEVELFASLDIAASLLTADDLGERFPGLSTCGAVFDMDSDEEHECVPHDVYLYEEEGGYSDPAGANQDLLEAARRERAEVLFRSPVVGLDASGGRVTGVELAGGERIDAPIVVNAAGPWCNQLNALAGVDLPWDVEPTRVPIVYRSLPDEVPGPIPVVGDASSGIYFRPEARGQTILVGSIREEDEQEVVADPDEFNRGVDQAMKNRLIFGIHHRIPSLPYRGEITAMSGLYTHNRDDVHPIIGPTQLEGYLVANGFSGHGFKLAPMVGSLVAQHITGTRVDFDTDVPIGFFAVDRDPLPMPEKTVLA